MLVRTEYQQFMSDVKNKLQPNKYYYWKVLDKEGQSEHCKECVATITICPIYSHNEFKVTKKNLEQKSFTIELWKTKLLGNYLMVEFKSSDLIRLSCDLTESDLVDFEKFLENY